jgi:hypothetical protein
MKDIKERAKKEKETLDGYMIDLFNEPSKENHARIGRVMFELMFGTDLTGIEQLKRKNGELVFPERTPNKISKAIEWVRKNYITWCFDDTGDLKTGSDCLTIVLMPKRK